MSGYFKIHRELFDKPIWVNSTIEQQIILITLLSMANWQPTEQEVDGEKINLNPGQFIASVEDIRKKINKPEITTKKIRGANERFRKLGFLANVRASKRANAKSIITIVNWRVYQCETLSEGKQKGERKGNERANAKPFEGKQPLYKNVEELEEINNNSACAREQTTKSKTVNAKSKTQKAPTEAKVSFAEFVSMTNAEYQALIDNPRLGSQAAANECIRILDNYKGASGRKYKSDYRAILTWVIDRFCEKQGKRRRNDFVSSSYEAKSMIERGEIIDL